jgi:toxin-antitoxin system PIN domain toxin
MILPDLNLLLYAYNRQAPQHRVASSWWESALNGSELIGLPHEVALGFVRISTNRRLGALAVSLATARSIVETWHASTNTRCLLPQEDHLTKVLDLMDRSGASGQLTSDASLAIYAMESRSTLYSNDSDFARFPGLSWINPLLAQ